MLNENAKKWVEALRSGKYKQCQNQMFDGDGYCCLGVAQLVVGLEVRQHSKLLTLPAMEKLGLTYQNGYAEGIRKSLANLNDAGTAFTEIADIIESEPEGLFVK